MIWLISQHVITFVWSQRWAISKLVESYLRCELPLNKYKMVPEHRFMEQFSSCKVPILPDNFYRMVEEGSIVLKKSQSLSFCSEDLVVDGEVEPLRADVVILATGFKSDEKLKNMFSSLTIQQCINGPSTTQVALYKSESFHSPKLLHYKTRCEVFFFFERRRRISLIFIKSKDEIGTLDCYIFSITI